MIIPNPTTISTNTNLPTSSAIHENKALIMQKQDQLKCPRCDSSNTKFCYYNNYSLSQPRHFCKACKRYWTRGGTLRNVPVGGGSRKNKRVKKNQQNSLKTNSNPNPSSNPINPNPDPINLISTSSAENNSLFYSAYDNINLVQPQFSSLGLGGYMANHNPNSNHSVGLNNINLNNILSNGYSSYGSEAAASILVSSLKRPKNEHSLFPNEGWQQLGQNQSSLVGNVDSNSIDQWQLNYQFGQSIISSTSNNVNGASDSYMYWNSAMGSLGWGDAMNSSVAHLI